MEINAIDADGKICWVQVDVATINATKITVRGTLEFVNDTVVNVVTISILGGRIVAGYENAPFNNSLVFNLKGDLSDQQSSGIGRFYIFHN